MLVPLLLLAAVGVGLAVMQVLAAADAANERAKLLVDVDATLAKPEVEGGELSRLVTALQKLSDHDTAHDALSAQARIELARARPERAQQLFGAIAGQPGATPSEQGLGAHILLRLHEAGTADASTAAGMLQAAIGMAEASYRESRQPGDLLRAWQAAERARLHDRSAGFAQQLTQNHAEAAESKFVHFAVAFDPNVGGGAVEAVMADLVPPPVEGQAMHAFALLAARDMPNAIKVAEQALARGAGVAVVRWAAAVTFHAGVLASAVGSEERARWVERRDAQLAWMTGGGNADEARAKQCAQMREIR